MWWLVDSIDKLIYANDEQTVVFSEIKKENNKDHEAVDDINDVGNWREMRAISNNSLQLEIVGGLTIGTTAKGNGIILVFKASLYITLEI